MIRMQDSALGRAVSANYPRLPFKALALRAAIKLEGGQLQSKTLRRVLEKHYGVIVGKYSYGSLLTPGHADRKTFIGSYVSIGPNVYRFGAAHPMDDLCLHPFWYNPKFGVAGADSDVSRTECRIEDGAWVGAGSIILPGCTRIGIGAVVGAGSVVTRDVADFAVVSGNPARERRLRLDEERRSALLRRRPWDLEPDAARRLLQVLRDES